MRHSFLLLVALGTAGSLAAAACGDSHNNPTTSSSSSGTGGSSATTSSGMGGATMSSSSTGQGGFPDAAVNGACKLPGSVQFAGGAVHVVPGGLPTCTGGQTKNCEGDLSYLKLPDGFCAHWFANVPNARQLRFAPGGELFVASPTTVTTGGGPNGLKAIVLLPDDDKNGYADKQITFLSNLPSTQGLMFANSYFYFQKDTEIRRMAYAPGDRTPSGTSELVVDVTVYSSPLHWPKTFDIADDGTIYLGNGGDQGEACDSSHPFHGGILKVPPTGTVPIEVAKGFRNPIAVRCAPGHNRCFAAELALDFSADDHGREKFVPIRDGDDWGFPCCATRNTPYTGTGSNPNCGSVALDKDSFFIGDTPFGIAFQSTTRPWPAPWNDMAIVALHGAAGSWTGARVVAIGVDPTTGLLVPGTNIHNHQDQGALTPFADGWDDSSLAHGRPASLEFNTADGRLFIGNDNSGDIIWIAPLDF
jgi:glucose/arabinose dehydrogenase